MRTRTLSCGSWTRVLFLCLVAGWLIAQTVGAREFFVDFAEGDDGDDGLSVNKAWKHAPGDPNAILFPSWAVLQAGDIVRFKGGVEYQGYINIRWSGSSSAPITYDGNSGGTWGVGRAIIDGQRDALGVDARRYGIVSSGRSNLVIDSFEIRNLRTWYHDVSGQEAYAIKIEDSGSSIVIRNCHLHDIFPAPQGILSGGDRAQGKTGTACTATSFHDATQDFTSVSTLPGQRAIYKILIGWSRTDGERAWAYVGPATDSHTINVYQDMDLTVPGWNANGDPSGHANRYFYWVYDMRRSHWAQNSSFGIRVDRHTGVAIHDNIVSDNRANISVNAFGSSCGDIAIYNNDLSRCVWGVHGTGTVGANLTNLRIYANQIHDFGPYVMDNWGWHTDGIFLYETGSPGIGVRNASIYGNVFYGDFRGWNTAIIYFSSGVSDVKIHNNAFASSSGEGYNIRINYDQNPRIWICNNTFAKIPGGPTPNMAFDYAQDLKIQNNIFHKFESYQSCFTVAPTATQGFSSDYNLFDSLRTSAEIGYNDGTYSLEQWKAMGANDQHSVMRAAPGFRSFPAFASLTVSPGTKYRLYYGDVPEEYGSDYAVGDVIEYEFDRIARRVTAVSRTAGYIEVTPPLSRNSGVDEFILNWKNNASLVYDLRLTSTSQAIDRGTDLSALIGNIDMEGVARPTGAAWDIGAHEYVPEAPPIPDTEPPTTPTAVVATALSASEIDLTWQPSTDDQGVSGYTIYRAPDDVTTPAVIGGSPIASFRDVGLGPEQAWVYWVQAYDAGGNVSGLSTTATAQTFGSHYIREGASGAGTGASWDDAWTSLPASLQRGHLYYLASGRYPAYVFDDAAAGAVPIEIRKATAADHGNDMGWLDDYTSGPAVFDGGVVFTTAHWILDGVGHNGDDDWRTWDSGHGIRIDASATTGAAIEYQAAENVAVRYADIIGGNETSGTVWVSSPSVSLSFLGCHIHESSGPLFLVSGAEDVQIERCLLARNGLSGLASERMGGLVSEGATTGCVIQHSAWRDIRGLGVWVLNGNDWDIYGNVVSSSLSPGLELTSGVATVFEPYTAINVRVRNNSFVSLPGPRCGIDLGASIDTNLARNNLWHNSGEIYFRGMDHDYNYYSDTPIAPGMFGPAHNNQIVSGYDPFQDLAGLDFQLRAPTDSGVSFGPPYNVDTFGVVRGADKVWDRGAYEREEVVDTTPPSIPSGIIASSNAQGTQMTLTWQPCTDNVAVVGYKIHRQPVGGSMRFIGQTTTPSFVDTGVYPTSVYFYQIEAYDPSDNSSQATIEARTLPWPPGSRVEHAFRY